MRHPLAVGLGVASIMGAAACGTLLAIQPDADPAADGGSDGALDSDSDASPADGPVVGPPATNPPVPVDFDAGTNPDVVASPIACDASDQCSAPAVCDQGACEKLVFVTSIATTGDVAGIAHADTICQSLATGAGLKGSYLAWLSTSATSPDTRFKKSDRAYVRPDGQKVAPSFAGLGAPLVPISVTEQNKPRASVRVRTATDAIGHYVTNGGVVADCAGFTSPSGVVANVFGLSSAVGNEWSYAGTYWCSEAQALYCFEQ